MTRGMDIEYLEWDSDELGIRAGLIDLTGRSGQEDGSALDIQLIELLKNDEKFHFVTVKLCADHIEAANSLIQNGATLIDTALTFVFAGYRRATPLTNHDFSFEFVNRVDGNLFLELADGMSLSRFYKDERIGYPIANRLWRHSIMNHCQGFADELLVAYHGSEPCGLITIAFRDNNQINLHIVGVLEKWRGKKIAPMMLRKISQRHGVKHKIFVETQSNNIRAQRVYQSSGFIFHHLTYIIHWWRDKNNMVL